MDIIWVSLDPVNPAIAPYPPPFNQRLEEAYQKFNPSDASSQRCVLGPDYFNSTIYFQKQGEVRRCPPRSWAPCGCVGRPTCHACVARGLCISSAYAWAVHQQRLSAHACCRRPGNTFRRPLPSTMDRVADASRRGTVIALSSPFERGIRRLQRAWCMFAFVEIWFRRGHDSVCVCCRYRDVRRLELPAGQVQACLSVSLCVYILELVSGSFLYPGFCWRFLLVCIAADLDAGDKKLIFKWCMFACF